MSLRSVSSGRRQATRRRLVALALGLAAAVAVVVLLAGGSSHSRAFRSALSRTTGHHDDERSGTSARPGVVPAAADAMRHCITRLGACGYPNRTNTGVPPGAQLTPRSGVIDIERPGQTIAGIALDGAIEVHASNTTIRDDDIVVNGTQKHCTSPCGGRGIFIAPGVKNTHVEDVTCHGGAASGANVTEFCIVSNDPTTVVNRVRAYWCTTCFIGPATWENSFVNLNGTIPKEHYEDIYYGGGSSSITIAHNTLLNPPHDQGDVATIFLSVDFGDQRRASITDNLLAGGGWLVYGGGSGSKGSVIGPMTYSGNRISTLFDPHGGSYGVGAYFKSSATAWKNNYWDDTLRQIPKP